MKLPKKKYVFVLLGLIILVSVIAFKWRASTAVVKAPPRVAAKYLDKKYAEFRSQQISETQYDLQLDITKPDSFTGSVKLDFVLKQAVDLTLDFYAGEVNQVLINGKKVEQINYNNFFIGLNGDDLLSGKNTVEVSFKQFYSKTGSGLYRFVDPEDKRVYLYSDFEPYDANMMFPCFDQPDLKATYKSTVTAPKGWELISTTIEEEKTPAGEHTEKWIFPESKKLSTYVYSLHAGEYTVWKSESPTRNHTIPLRLFARQSMAKYVDPEEWFATTQQGFVFYEDYFDFPYPYHKYDQLIVPDFNSGAMENAAAVTFSESRYISRGVKQRIEKRRLAEVMLHEMAHMWFGDLVTMRWWNDIWLNESFATYIATHALVAATPYKESWVDFAASEKQRAYWEDQLVTTHPIEFEVPNTDVVFANFDGITYGKGASVLKQLAFFIGEEDFQSGLRDYFKVYAYQNTNLGEFMNELSETAQMDLEGWQKVWLQIPQVNTIKVDYTCNEGKVETAFLRQQANAQFPALRPHKTLVGIFTMNANKLKARTPIEVVYGGAEQAIPEMEGLDCKSIALIYPNMDDHDYVKVELDEMSLAMAQQKINATEDAILRIGLWTSLWDRVLDQKMAAPKYLDIFLKNSLQEKNTDVLRGPLEKALLVVQYYLPQDDAWKVQRNKILRQVSAHFITAMQKSQSVDLQKLWFDSFVTLAEQPIDLNLLSDVLAKRPGWLQFDVDQDRRWNIITTLNQRAHGDYQKLHDLEKSKDSTDRGAKAALAAEAARPDLEVKKRFWKELAQGPGKEFPVAKLRPVVEHIFPVEQLALQEEFRVDFYKSLRDLNGTAPEYLKIFAGLAPAPCTTEGVNSLKEFAQKNLDLIPQVTKKLKVIAQESERCVAIRAKAIETQLQ